MKTLLISSIAAGLTLVGSVALAGHHGHNKQGGQMNHWLAKLDTNKDGVVTLDEMQHASKAKRAERATKGQKRNKPGKDGARGKGNAAKVNRGRSNQG